MADENMQHVDLGEDSVCPGFNDVPEGDIIKYARLGRLMPESRPQEINFRGKGKMYGYHVKMNDYSISYESNDESKNEIYDDILQKLEDIPITKSFMGDIHSMIIKYFETLEPISK